MWQSRSNTLTMSGVWVRETRFCRRRSRADSVGEMGERPRLDRPATTVLPSPSARLVGFTATTS